MADASKGSEHNPDQKSPEPEKDRKEPTDPMGQLGERGNRPSPRMPPFLNYLVIALIIFYGIQLFSGPGMEELDFTEFKQRVEAGEVASVTIEGHTITGTFASKEAGDAGELAEQPRDRFQTQVPEVGDPQVVELLEQNNVTIEAEPSEPQWWSRLLVGLLPWLLIAALIFYFWRRMQGQMGGGQQGGLFSFGKSRARRYSRDDPQKSFDDVAGSEGAKRDLTEIVEYLKDPTYYQKLGAKLPRGVLMVGPPGTGKTLMARAVAGEADVPFFSISGSEFIEMFVGVGASRVRNMFEEARKESPSIIFIDELDAIGRARGAGVGGGHDEREQTLNQILSEMDGFSPHETVVVIAATNRPDVLDPALLRPGRFDRKVTLDRPHREARKEILKIHTKPLPLDEDVSLDAIARRTVGFSGADLENLANEAALFAGRDGSNTVAMGHFDKARDKLLMGAEREQTINDKEKELIAYHESGHALTALLFANADPLEKVTIIPRGQALGATEQAPDEDRLNMTASYARDRIAVMLGGRVSEQVIFGEVSSGAQQDIEQATKLARRMVSQWGMSDAIGPVSVSASQEEVFLGQDISKEREFSDATAEKIDEEVRKLITQIESDVKQKLEENRKRLETLAEHLLEEETLEADRISELLDLPAGSEHNDGREETDRKQRGGDPGKSDQEDQSSGEEGMNEDQDDTSEKVEKG
ncbi:cell division protease FtsH [Marinobacter daqiaonensis]|uniref:ATP-dependent zinc metalloprotease FtsH n=1 Tax=Marinobacter daqiaonensis TaxID=650891 RepID=A0A1I6J6F5_9GAMM|nr:ATP-dependent zinc metalloprotease FtsH [Marinobacter daqiaonensis]SFR74556.1 cell division protease FtsH [Marinobacter daqiaonensis]